ncbi:MAG: hypothetical protein F4X81_16405 [Gammaproteobacteria bacterium]|nr:hypothetical protein [Gammaproteobacteria bacterium]MYE53035.1 hypothetical protein [Gammaproteobacteria bacterium]
MTKEIAEFAFDLHTGLGSYDVPDFDDLKLIGMAATLSIHIRGLGEIPYEVLRKVSDHLMKIPSIALEPILLVLNDLEFVQLVRSKKRISKVIPRIPVFDDIYQRIGAYADSECQLNSHEEASLMILDALQKSPENRDALFNRLGIEKPLFDRCIKIGNSSGILSEHMARGRHILISPFYFMDNLDTLADAAAAVGSNAISSTLSKVKNNQGWPLGLIRRTEEIGGTKLDKTELAVIQKLATEGIVRPPTIKFGKQTESFLFTPRPGKTRLNAANREIYERAMALISAIRKGQLLPDRYRIRQPVVLLRALRDRGYLRANSEARDQYRNLVVLKVATLKHTSGDRWQLHLHKTSENEKALDLAITLLKSGDLAGMEVNQDARIALTRDEEYIQSLISSKELKKRDESPIDPQASVELEQLILKL